MFQKFLPLYSVIVILEEYGIFLMSTVNIQCKDSIKNI